MEEIVLILADRQEVTLNLYTLVTASHVGFAETVAHAGHFLDKEREVACANIPRVHGVLKSKSSLELTNFDREELVFSPLHIEILHVRAAVELELDPVVELMVYTTVNVRTDDAGIEAGAAVCAFEVAVFI